MELFPTALALALLLPPAAEEPFADLGFDAALARAREQEKFVLIDFFTTWCAPCKRMDRDTWADAEVRAWLAERAVALKIDAEEEVELARRYAVTAYPTVLLVAPDGTELDRIVGYLAPDAFLEEAAGILAGRGRVDELRARLASGELRGAELVEARHELGRELARRGAADEALEHLLWVYDHALEHARSYSGVRSSFLLSEIVRLGEGGREALRARRDALEPRVLALAGGADLPSMAYELARLNDVLGDGAATVRVLDGLSEPLDDPAAEQRRRRARGKLVREVFPLLVEDGRYQEVLDALDPSEHLARKRSIQGHGLERLDEEDREAMRAVMRRDVAEEGGVLLRAAIGAGDEDEAREVLDELERAGLDAAAYATLLAEARRIEEAPWGAALVLERSRRVTEASAEAESVGEGAAEAQAKGDGEGAPERADEGEGEGESGDDGAAGQASAGAPPAAEREWIARLEGGRLAEVAGLLEERVASGAADATDRFGLGLARALGAVETLARSLRRHGARLDLGMPWPAGVLRLPAPDEAEPIGADDLRAILATFVRDLDAAAEALAEVGDGEVRLPLRPGLVRLDVDGDGVAHPDEALGRVVPALLGRFVPLDPRQVEQAATELVLVLDSADAAWLEGYVQLVAAVLDGALAYDWQRPFDHAAHLFLERPETPFAFLAEDLEDEDGGWEGVLDVIALVHTIDLPVREPERLRSALARLERVLERSRTTFERVLAEEDDDREWIPSPRQTGVVGLEVTEQVVAGWRTFLDEAEDLLAGRKLVPFWRASDLDGLNLRRVFEEPRRFDLLLWIQGSAAVPYLEEGEVTSAETWRTLRRALGGDLLWFAVWFN